MGAAPHWRRGGRRLAVGGSSGGPRPTQRKPKQPAPPKAGEGGYTNRLLEAKRRARRELEEQEKKDE